MSMTMTQIVGVDGFGPHAGTDLGISDWVEITQEQVDEFARATRDHNWLHVDVERARQGPFGGTIAHGYFVLSLIPVLLQEVMVVSDTSMALNYGLNRVRFIAPVRVGTRVRLRATLATVEEIDGGVRIEVDMTFEREGDDKPGCVASAIYTYYR